MKHYFFFSKWSQKKDNKGIGRNERRKVDDAIEAAIRQLLLASTRWRTIVHVRFGKSELVKSFLVWSIWMYNYLHSNRSSVYCYSFLCRYIKKGIGELVTESPLTVRLNFEPAGRAVGQTGMYYLTAKENHCVVCGYSEKYVRKNVVPREYRKYFPSKFPIDATAHPLCFPYLLPVQYLSLRNDCFSYSCHERSYITRCFVAMSALPSKK